MPGGDVLHLLSVRQHFYRFWLRITWCVQSRWQRSHAAEISVCERRPSTWQGIAAAANRAPFGLYGTGACGQARHQEALLRLPILVAVVAAGIASAAPPASSRLSILSDRRISPTGAFDIRWLNDDEVAIGESEHGL